MSFFPKISEMSLHTLITIKAIVHYSAIIILFYLVYDISDIHKELQEQNNFLLEQKGYYEQILQPNGKDPKNQQSLYVEVQRIDPYLKSKSPKNEYEIRAKVVLVFIVTVIICNFFNYMDKRIDKLKSLQTEAEKLDLL